MSGAGESPYHVACPGRELKKLREWLRQARRLGKGDEFLRLVAVSERRLMTDPISWGDPQYHLSRMGLLVLRGTYQYLQVIYGVDEIRRIVYISDFELLPWHPPRIGESS